MLFENLDHFFIAIPTEHVTLWLSIIDEQFIIEMNAESKSSIHEEVRSALEVSDMCEG